MSQLEFTEDELKAFRAEYAKGSTDTQFDLFISECKARNLRPGVHLVFQLRRAKEYDPTTGAYVWFQKPFWITTIAALRLIAQRTEEYLGQGPEEYVYLDAEGNPTIKSEIPLPHENPKLRPLPREPWVARATVYRKGFNQPMIGMARFEAYAETKKTDDGPVLTETWRRRGSEQLFKCAEALAFRKAFPEEMAGLLLSEELKDIEEEKPLSVTPASVVSLPVSAPAVDQTPATPTDAPRPNEKPVVTLKEVEKVEEFLANPATQEKLAEKGLKVNQPAIDRLKADVTKAVPGVKPASEIKPKRGRKPNPVNGQDLDPGITDEDIATVGQPVPEVNTEEIKKSAEEFVASVDPTPTKEEQADFTARVRVLTAAGVASLDLKNYILATGGKTDTKQLTVRDWRSALETLEAAHQDGKLKETIAEKLREVSSAKVSE